MFNQPVSMNIRDVLQKEDEVLNGRVAKPTKSRRRRMSITLVACVRCKGRKQKCDGDFESGSSCSNCSNSGKECVYESKKSPHYVKSLEAKLESLQKELDNLRNEPRVTSPPIAEPSIVSKMAQALIEELKESETYRTDINWSALLNELLVNNELVNNYFNIYIERVHSKYPMLDNSYIQHLKNNRWSILDSSNESRVSDRFTCLMICAVGARIMSDKQSHMADSSPSTAPENHMVLYINALCLNLSKVFMLKELTQLNALLLLVIYLLRTPNCPTIWELIRFAMGVCIEFGLHRRNLELFEKNPVQYQLRARTFWTAYSLERVISNSFGRPYSISDFDIDVHLPLDIEEQYSNEAEYIRTKFYLENPHLNHMGYDTSTIKLEKSQRTYLTMSIHFFKLRKIDSEIQSIIYRVDQPQITSIPIERINELQDKMKTWIQGLPELLSTFEFDYCMYLFSKQICSLSQPFITKLDSEDLLFTETMRSCVDICLLSRRIHQSSSYQESFISLQTAFLAGVTLVYGLLSGKIGWNFEVSEGLRNCSSVLYLFSERSSSASKFRDMFEALLFEVNQMRYDEGQRSLSQTKERLQISDLFGKELLKKRLKESHKIQNLKLFETLSKPTFDDPFGKMFEPENIDDLFESLWKIEEVKDNSIDRALVHFLG